MWIVFSTLRYCIRNLKFRISELSRNIDHLFTHHWYFKLKFNFHTIYRRWPSWVHVLLLWLWCNRGWISLLITLWTKVKLFFQVFLILTWQPHREGSSCPPPGYALISCLVPSHGELTCTQHLSWRQNKTKTQHIR